MADSDKTNYFDMFAKMANPGGLPFQNLFFSPLDKEAITKKIGELETVRTWLQTSLGVLDASVKALEFQLSMLEKAQKKRPILAWVPILMAPTRTMVKRYCNKPQKWQTPACGVNS